MVISGGYKQGNYTSNPIRRLISPLLTTHEPPQVPFNRALMVLNSGIQGIIEPFWRVSGFQVLGFRA